jgi:hypothetical protein
MADVVLLIIFWSNYSAGYGAQVLMASKAETHNIRTFALRRAGCPSLYT